MRIIKGRTLDNIVIDLPDNLESLKFIINNRFYFSSLWYEYIKDINNGCK